MSTRLAGDLEPDAGVDDPAGVSDLPVLDSLNIIDSRLATADADAGGVLGRFLRARRPRASANRCRRNARRSDMIAECQAGVSDDSPILSESSFTRLLQREQRRADRSHAPLSLMLFRVDASASRTDAPGESFVRCLQRRKRETDYLGRLADDLFVVLLPDTAADGTRQFNERLQRMARGISYSSCSATYPEDRLEPLLDGRLQFTMSTAARLAGEYSAGGAGGYALKRPIDIVGALALLLLAAPIMLVTATAILLTSRGPVIFRQSRLGEGSVPFAFYKFRSMRVDARDDVHRSYVENLIKGRTVAQPAHGDDRLAYKMNADSRITPVGRWIRKTSIDELPQLWNVLKGDMSLVGPRPPIPYEAENYQSWHLRRVLEVKPGITGLWQVEGRSRVSFDDMVRMDIQYAQNCSLWLDLRILARTAWVVLKCEGAG